MRHALEVITLGRLIETGIVKRTNRNGQLIQRFDDARWIEPSGRKEEWRVRDGMISNIEARMSTLLPSWRDEFQFLRSLDLDPLDPRSVESLSMLRKKKIVTGLVNRRNWNAATGLGPKHTSQTPPSATLTKDWVMRFRPNKGLRGMFGGNEIDFWLLSKTMTECVIPERLWLQFEGFVGDLPKLVVTCENLGAFVDLTIPDMAMAVYSPGADIEIAAELLKRLPNSKWAHFGDIDPDGLEIADGLARETNRPLTFFVPSFVGEYLPGCPVKTPWAAIPEATVFHDLKKAQKRIFQEVFMLDSRLSSEIEAMVESL